MLKRSMEKNGVKKANYIGNSDSVTYKGILELDPYDIHSYKNRKM